MNSDTLSLQNDSEEIKQNNPEQIKSDFYTFRTERRQKIITIDRIIRDNNEFNDSELDVLFRGFIVLIYAFWEGNYKELQNIFFEFFKYEKIKKLPHNIQHNVILELSLDKPTKNSKFGEIKDYLKFKNIYDNIVQNLEKTISDFEKVNLRYIFDESSNNPDYNKLKLLLGKVHLNLDNLIYAFSQNNNFPENFKERLSFLIFSRNSIAHGQENSNEYSTYQATIKANFFNNESIDINTISEFLLDTSFYIDVLYKIILEAFLDKYGNIGNK